MKVNEILNEGVIPPHIKMTLQSIVANGGSTNSAHLIILANAVELLKNYPSHEIWIRKLNSYNAANGDTMDLFRSMDGHEQAELASWCLDILDGIADRDEVRCHPECTTKEFTDKILRAQR